jgi:uncharacterized glyoxalase superfamily protein PhnB
LVLLALVAPYLDFQGQARDAMEHYHKVLGGKLEMFASNEHGRPKPVGQGAPGGQARHDRTWVNRSRPPDQV